MDQRKATDVLVELEAKVDVLTDLVRSQDLVLKVLSNKLNILLESYRQTKIVPSVSAPSAEVVNMKPIINEKQIPISSEDNLPLEHNPVGFRRTSRPETYTNNDVQTVLPIQIPQKNTIVNAIAPIEATSKQVEQVEFKDKDVVVASQNSIPIIQRVVDASNKSVFLADVEIFNSSGDRIHKSRTNGTGKWMASLLPATYKVVLRKRDSISKERVEVSQDIVVDGKTTPLNLPTLVFK